MARAHSRGAEPRPHERHLDLDHELTNDHVVQILTVRMTSSHKTCFVTIGATASFSGLIKTVLSGDFFQALESQGYTDLLVQYGQDGEELFNSCVTEAKNTESGSVLQVHGFALDKAGLRNYMLQARGGKDGQEGVVISHAGMLSGCRVVCIVVAKCVRRLWYDPGRSPTLSPSHCRAQLGVARQPSGGARGSSGRAGVRCAWQTGEFSTSTTGCRASEEEAENVASAE